MTIRKILWIDGLGALIAGIAVLSTRGILSGPFGLPERILLIQSVITIIYGTYSTTLAKNKIYSKKPIRVLAIANLMYVAFCMLLFMNNYYSTTVLGKVYFIAEAMYICGLAILEFRQLKYLG
jgi:hypothetical protein